LWPWLLSSGHGSAPIGARPKPAEFGSVGVHMSSISCARTSYVPLVSATGIRNVVRLFAVVLGAASLAACAQSSVVTKNSERSLASRQAAPERTRSILATNRRVEDTEKRAPFSPKNAADTQATSHGVASFYSTGKQTASGERFDRYALTAAHRTLPFGTRLRVTNVATGQSVTVRVNDRGPFIPGRVVDVSHSAAEALGMVGNGVAKVKVDVVQ
jgi:rare lipoprotein A